MEEDLLYPGCGMQHSLEFHLILSTEVRFTRRALGGPAHNRPCSEDSWVLWTERFVSWLWRGLFSIAIDSLPARALHESCSDPAWRILLRALMHMIIAGRSSSQWCFIMSIWFEFIWGLDPESDMRSFSSLIIGTQHEAASTAAIARKGDWIATPVYIWTAVEYWRALISSKWIPSFSHTSNSPCPAFTPFISCLVMGC